MTLSGFVGRWPGFYALSYFIVAVLLATLAPFDFHWLSAGTWPAWRANASDILQNVLLFLPLGLILAQMRGTTLMQAMLLGFMLSASVEFAQLSLIGRSSNFVDVVTNTNGALAGWVYGKLLGRNGVVDGAELVLSLMMLPLCWVIAMRTDREEFISVLIIPAALAALAAFKNALAPSFMRQLHVLAWLGMALLPLLYMSRWAVRHEVAGIPFTLDWICIALVSALTLFTPVERLAQKYLALLLALVFVVAAVVDALWFQSQGSGLRWTAHVHLHWALEVIALALFTYWLLWVRSQPRRV